MRLHRFYTTEHLTTELSYTHTEHLHQWRNVFRYVAGDSVILFGDGFEHSYRIEHIDKKSAALVEIAVSPSRLQSRECSLALALIKKDNFELVLEKCTELGVTDFYPMTTERSLQKMYSIERLQKILIEAAEQSGWGSVPTLHTVQSFESLLPKNKCIIFDMSGGRRISLASENSILCIGSEGGFTERELELAKKNEAELRSLASGVLRAETAAISVIALKLLS